MKRGLTIAGFALVCLMALVLWLRYGDYWRVDGCLDSGGAWNRTSKVCQQ